MTGLDYWLKEATRRLAKESASQVRTEIQEHYELARETALGSGLAEGEAARRALAALGDAQAANRQYRRVLLTSGEARVLRNANWEARAICSSPWLKRMLLAMPAAGLLAAIVLFVTGPVDIARTLLAGAIGIGVSFAAPFLPVCTPSRGRTFRYARWVAMVAMLGLAFGPDTLKWWWLLGSCLWPMAWIEWTRVSIRRKLPVAQWPKQLYI